MQVVFEHHGQPDVAVDVPVGTRVLDAAVQAGALVQTQCGGVMACLACRVVLITPASVSAAGEKERGLLSLLKAPQSHRLACQARVQAETTVGVLPPDEDGFSDDVTLD